MPDYTKQTQTGTDKSGQPVYATETAWYKQKKRKRRKSKKARRKTTAARRNPLLMMGA